MSKSKKLLKRLADSGKNFDLTVDVMQAKNATDIGVKVILTIVNPDFKIEKKVQGLGISTSFDDAEAEALSKALEAVGI